MGVANSSFAESTSMLAVASLMRQAPVNVPEFCSALVT
jgi:hypothetical protein